MTAPHQKQSIDLSHVSQILKYPRQVPERVDALILHRCPVVPGMVQSRTVGWVVLFTVISFGVYGLYWLYAVTRELRAATGDTELRPWRNVVFTLSTCGLGGYLAAYRLDQCLQRELVRAYPRSRAKRLDDAALILLPALIPGLGLLIAQGLLQRDLNRLASAALHSQGHDVLLA